MKKKEEMKLFVGFAVGGFLLILAVLLFLGSLR